jgi:MFS superfamily sulfate permease-like transporter
VLVASALVLGLHLANLGADVATSWVGNLTVGLGLGIVGTVLARRLPHNPIGWLMVAGGTAQITVGLGREWAVFATVTHPGLPGATWAAWFGSWPFCIAIATMPLVVLFFPDGHLMSRRWRALVWLIVTAATATSIAAAVQPGPFTDALPELQNPVGVSAVPSDAVAAVGQIGVVLAILLAIGSLVG